MTTLSPLSPPDTAPDPASATLHGAHAASLSSILAAAAIGAVLVFTAGLSQSATLHDAAHDVRHATGFPCH